jgi:hypothetical protein
MVLLLNRLLYLGARVLQFAKRLQPQSFDFGGFSLLLLVLRLNRAPVTPNPGKEWL